NYLGVELNAKLLIFLLFVQLALLGVFVGFAAPAVHGENFVPLLGENGVFGVLAGAAVFFWSWDGFLRMAIMASEVKEPRRTIPFAIVGGIAFSAVVFLVVPAVRQPAQRGHRPRPNMRGAGPVPESAPGLGGRQRLHPGLVQRRPLRRPEAPQAEAHGVAGRLLARPGGLPGAVCVVAGLGPP